MSIPEIGTNEFRVLDFKKQLEVVSLQLFQPDQYIHLTGKKIESENLSPIDYPPLPEFEIFDLPLAFVSNYYAAYNCRFKRKWFSPVCFLEKFGIEPRRLVNIWSFNFSFLVVYPAINRIFSWIAKEKYNGWLSSEALLETAKVYAFMEYLLRDVTLSKKFEKEDAEDIYYQSLYYFYDQIDFDELNEQCPIIQETDEMLFLESQDLCVYASFRMWKGKFFYPLIPSEMFAPDSRFHIYNWNLLNPHVNK